MALHIISSEKQEALSNAMQAYSGKDDIIFIQNGCYQLTRAPKNSYFLSSSIQQRGLSDQFNQGVDFKLASSEDFLKLTETHQQVLTWF